MGDLASETGNVPIERLWGTSSLLREIIEVVPGAVYAKDRAGRILLGNGAFADAVGWPSGGFLGKDDLELLADKDLARVVMENDRRIMAGNSKCQVEEMLRAEDGTTSHWLSTKVPFRDDGGNVVGLIGVSIDITDRKRLEERQKLLAREIEHRNKNLLSIVQSVVRLTRAATVEEYRDALAGRFEALSRAQGVLVRESHQQELRALLLEGLSAYSMYAEGRVRVSGPPVRIGADALQPFAMIFHELATNAAKYGAFADTSGTLEVNWELSRRSDARLVLEWRETRSSPLAAPVDEGFGTSLMRSVVEHQLQGELSFVWEPNGLRCTISVPLPAISPA